MQKKIYFVGYLLDCHKTGTAAIEDAMPFSEDQLAAVARLEKEKQGDERNVVDNDEVKIVTWICARFARCLLTAKMVPRLETEKMLDVLTIDDIAFLILVFEDTYRVWMKMADAKKDAGQTSEDHESDNGSRPPPPKRICRGTYKDDKKFKNGNGLSSKKAQSRYATLRLRIHRYNTNPHMKGALEEAYDKSVEEFCAWEEKHNLRGNDGATKGAETSGAAVASSEPAFVDEVSRQMLQAYASVVQQI